MAGRLLAILARVAAVVGTGFLRGTRFEGVAGVLWQRLMSAGRRFRRAGSSRVRASRAGEVRAVRSKPEIRLPCQKGWLVKELGYRVTTYAAQLSDLLDEPEMRAVIDAVPCAGRVLRPICWMLGISRNKATSAGELAARKVRRAERRAAAAPVVRRKPAGARARPAHTIWQAPPVPSRAQAVPPEIAWNFAKSR